MVIGRIFVPGQFFYKSRCFTSMFHAIMPCHAFSVTVSHNRVEYGGESRVGSFLRTIPEWAEKPRLSGVAPSHGEFQVFGGGLRCSMRHEGMKTRLKAIAHDFTRVESNSFTNFIQSCSQDHAYGSSMVLRFPRPGTRFLPGNNSSVHCSVQELLSRRTYIRRRSSRWCECGVSSCQHPIHPQ